MKLQRYRHRLSVKGTLAALALLAAPGTGLASDSLYEVARVSVDTTAKDAVVARALGLAEAGQKALRVVLKRLVPGSAQAMLPPISDQDVEAMISSLSVRSEQNSTTRYLATFDVSFNEIAVKEFLDRRGVPFSEARAAQISILPLVLDGAGLKSEGAEGWRQAWQGLDLSHSIAPANILRPRDSLDAETVKKVLAGNASAYEAMQADYGYAPLVLAVAETGGGRFVTRLAGADSVGAINFGRSDALQVEDLQAAAQHAASIAFGIIENRWKITQSREASQPVAAAYRTVVPESPRAPGIEVPRNVCAMVEFSGLKHWQEIRGRLAHVAGVQAIEVNSLSARAASITFDFAGPFDRLQAELDQNGFALEDRNGTFVLRSR
jgi:hypothetical protein